MPGKDTIVLYNYAFSPFGKRVEAYLALRGIEYALCEVSFVMPRPELELIPVHYRRIPILAIGRDIYLDTRLQLRALEALPGVTTPRLGATNPSDLFVEKLLEKLINEGPVFAAAAGMVPMEIAQNEQFNKDRQGLFGNQWTKEEIEENLGGSANYIKNLFAFLEETALKDGREWILTGDGPKMADIEVAFMLDWITNLAVPEGLITAQGFPKVFAWLDRYRAAVAKAKATANGPTALDGQGAADAILRSDFGQSRVSVDPNDVTGWKEGTEVEFYPVDWLTGHRDRGRLVGLTTDEVTIAAPSKKDVEVHIHAPRAGFKIKETKKN